MSVLKDRETLCECGENILRIGVLTQKHDLLYNIMECVVCHNIYIIKSEVVNFKQYSKNQFIKFLSDNNINF